MKKRSPFDRIAEARERRKVRARRSTGLYDPHRGTIAHGTAYQQAHEYAHQEQHARNGLLWRARMALRSVPFIGRLLTVAVEIQASVMARAEMQAAHIWTEADAQEARDGLLSSLLSLTIFGRFYLPNTINSQSTQKSPAFGLNLNTP